VPDTDRGQGPAAASEGHGAGEHTEGEAPRAEAAELRRRTAGKPKLELGHTWTRSSSALPERRPALDRLSGQRANELSTARCQAGGPGLFAPKRRRDRLSRSGRHHQPGTEQPLAYRSADLARPRYRNPVAFRHNVAVSELPSTGMRGNMARRMDGGAPAPVAEREARQLKR
jgi:hypothetical protein